MGLSARDTAEFKYCLYQLGGLLSVVIAGCDHREAPGTAP